MINRQDCTVLVCSSDKYADCWDPFFTLFKKYWSECPYDIVLNTESKAFEMDGLDIICYQFYTENEKVPYGERLLRHLKTIKTPNVIILMDDFFLRKKVDSEKVIQYAHELSVNTDIAVFSFDSIKDEMNIDDGKYNDFILRPQCGEYKLNFQGGVWRKSSLISLIRAHESPWEIEIKGSIRSFEIKQRFYTLKDISLSPIDYGKKKGLTWGIVRGKWVYDDVVPLFEEHQIMVDFSQRGFFDKLNYEDIAAVKRNSIFRDVQSYGIRYCGRMASWRMIHIVQKLLHLPYDIDYVLYRRRKEKSRYLK